MWSAPRLGALVLALLVVVPAPARAKRPAQARCVDDAQRSARRDRAVLAGARWLARYLDEPAHLEAVKSDAPDLFLELGATAASPEIRDFALAEARTLAERLLPRYVHPEALVDREELIMAVSLVGIGEALHLASIAPLRERVSARVVELGTPEAVLGATPGHLDALSEDALFNLLLDAWALQRAHLELPALRLSDVLAFVLRRRFVRFEDDRSPGHHLFTDHFYLATHVFYVLGDYGAHRVEVSRAPDGVAPLLDWVRGHYPALERHGDLELIAELVDVLRAVRVDDAHADTGDDTDAHVLCRGTRRLLAAQRPDGSWQPKGAGTDPYYVIHPTWTAVHALRARRWR